MSQHTNWVHLIPQDGRFNFKKKEELLHLMAIFLQILIYISIRAVGARSAFNHIMTTTFTTPLPPLDSQTFLRPYSV